MPRLWDLPYDSIVKTVFHRAAERAGVPCRGLHYPHGALPHILTVLGAMPLGNLARLLRLWSEDNREVHKTLRGEYSSEPRK